MTKIGQFAFGVPHFAGIARSALVTFEMFGTSDLPRLLHRLAHQAPKAGPGDQELAAIQ